MEKQLFENESQLQKIELLRDNAETTEEIGYMKPFSDDQLQEFRDVLVNSTIEHAELKTELDSIKSDYKSRMDPVKKHITENAKRIKEKAEYVKEKCYKIIDYNTKEVGYYNSEGILVFQRPARADEMQYTIKNLKPAVNQ